MLTVVITSKTGGCVDAVNLSQHWQKYLYSIGKPAQYFSINYVNIKNKKMKYTLIKS